MGFHHGTTLIVFLLGFLFVHPKVDARSWDLAVTVGKDIDFLARNGSLVGRSIITNATLLQAMAYDDETNTMFLSDSNSHGNTIFSVDLRAKNLTYKPILKRDKDSQIQSMVFDGPSRTLFWTTKWTLMRMKVPRDRLPSNPQLVHKFDMESARDIALDSCNRRIYWATSNRSSPSIMRSNLDGSDVTTLITDNLYEPTSIAVDHTNSRLYWIDDEEGIHYKLETSNLDGSGRTILVHSTHQTPVHLALDRQNLYWTEIVHGAVWKVGKEPLAGDLPDKFVSYYEDRQADPASIIARDNLGKGIDCKAMKLEEEKRMTKKVAPKLESFNNLTSSREDLRDEVVCFNGGTTNAESCRCRPGYSGSRCEISACHNYCLQGGECFVNDKGLPMCECPTSHSGLRCEHDICDGYCLNGATCKVDNGKPSCDCKYSSSGVRCEVSFNMAEICALFCVDRQLQITGIDTSTCRCAQLNQTMEAILEYDSFNCTLLVPLLAAFTGMLAIVVIVLSVYVNRLRRRPRVKKRFVVNKGGGIAPLTARPSQLSTDQCEITIENCCNMNICETPCFEPKLRTSGTRSNGVTKKEEKSNLLDNMEGNNNAC